MAMKGLFMGRSEGGKSYAAPSMSIALEDKDEAIITTPAEPLKPFTIELKTTDRTVRIAENGEIWIGSTLAGRLFREQTRELWALVSTALKENASTQAFAKSGTLTVNIPGDKDGPVSEARKKVLEYVMGLVQ